MNREPAGTETNYQVESDSASTMNDNYASTLIKHNLNFTEEFPYLKVGSNELTQGWIIHLSVIERQIDELISTIIPLLIEAKCCFKIPINFQVGQFLLSGYYGYEKLAKIVTIYPINDSNAVQISKTLLLHTKGFFGPDIPTDHRLQGIIYTRYGAIQPIISRNAEGQILNMIYGPNNELVEDAYHVPFILPKGITWPFSEITTLQKTKPEKILNDKYQIVQQLKSDAKGKVIKARYFKSWYSFTWCILKQGKKYMSLDPWNRDVRDRLKWQFELHKALENKILIPKIYEYFEIEGDGYISMEFIKGRDLSEVISEIYNGNTWATISSEERLRLINYLSDLLNIIEILHTNGYYHRDLNLRNFILNKHDRNVSIDLELAFNYKEKRPNPAFALGTIGYMSPEQQKGEYPTLEQDLYGIAAFMIKFFTGMSPTKFDTSEPKRLKDNLHFIIGNNSLAELISKGLSSRPADRPGIHEIKKNLSNINIDALLEKSTIERTLHEPLDLKEIIEMALKCLITDKFQNNHGLWYSNDTTIGRKIANQNVKTTIYAGVHEGISGVILLLVTAKNQGFSIEPFMETLIANFQYLEYNYFNNLESIGPSLYYGAAGISKMLIESIKAEIIPRSDAVMNMISLCLSSESTELCVATGVAGFGLALMSAKDLYRDETIKIKCNKYVALLISKQKRNGSWKMSKPGTKDDEIEVLGFSYGIAGIIYFLLRYANEFNSEDAQKAALRGLTYLTGQGKTVNGYYRWYINPYNQIENAWFDIGSTGIALTFITAYKTTQELKFKEIAEQILYNHPNYINVPFVGFLDGIIGLGEVYIEAFKAFKNEEWKKRADWITHYLTHSYIKHNDTSIFWMNNNRSNPTADLMSGNGGIIQYLISYSNISLRSFPIY